MTESDWLACGEPDLMLEVVEERKVEREKLVDFVRGCWLQVSAYLPTVRSGQTVVEEFAAIADQLSEHDVVLYAAEAALKAARYAPNFEEEKRKQAALLRQIFGNPIGQPIC